MSNTTLLASASVLAAARIVKNHLSLRPRELPEQPVQVRSLCQFGSWQVAEHTQPAILPRGRAQQRATQTLRKWLCQVSRRLIVVALALRHCKQLQIVMLQVGCQERKDEARRVRDPKRGAFSSKFAHMSFVCVVIMHKSQESLNTHCTVCVAPWQTKKKQDSSFFLSICVHLYSDCTDRILIRQKKC